MALLVDSSVFIALERRSFALDVLLNATLDETLGLASITASELFVGVHRARVRERQIRREAFVESILAIFPALPFDTVAARTHANLLAEMLATGQQIGSHDLLIGATALANDYSVLTLNARDFERIPGLGVQVPLW